MVSESDTDINNHSLGAALMLAWRESIRPTIRDKLEWMSSHPVIGGVAPASGAFAGLLGSLYSVQIKDAFPFYLGPNWAPIAAPVAAFWFFLFVFSVLYGSILWGQNRSNARQFDQADKLSAQAADLFEAVKTLPPKGFLDNFVELYKEAYEIAHEVCVRASKKEDIADLEEATRVILASLSTLAYLYDVDAKNNDKYAANVFVYRPVAGLSEMDFQLLRNRTRFIDPTAGRDAIEGFLDLKRALSTSIESDEPVVDASIVELALPIPVEREVTIDGKDKSLSLALPGAPYAFCRNQPEVFLDTATIADWCYEHGNFAPKVAEEMRGYFGPNGQGKGIKSFISFPIPAYIHCNCGVNTSGGSLVSGVVNIHRNRVGILQGKGLELFAPLTEPFCRLLSQLLHKHDELSAQVASA